MKFVNPYHWLYTKVYLQQRAVNATNIHFSVVIGMTLAELFYVASMVNICIIIFHVSIPEWIINSPKYTILCYIILVFTQFFYFSYKGRRERVLLEFKAEEILKKPYYYAPGLAFEVLSFLLFMFTIMLMFKFK